MEMEMKRQKDAVIKNAAVMDRHYQKSMQKKSYIV